MMHDTIASALSNILNADKVGKEFCLVKPHSKMLKEVLTIMDNQGYIGSFEVINDGRGDIIKVNLIGKVNKCGAIKPRFSVTPYDIGQSVGALIEIAQRSQCGRNETAPAILILAPPPLGKLTEYAETFSGGVEKSRKLASYYRTVAAEHGCEFLDTSTVIQSSSTDGLHVDPEDHEILGKAIAEIVKKILG